MVKQILLYPYDSIGFLDVEVAYRRDAWCPFLFGFVDGLFWH